jgi:UDP:flavonoid glycosyltransferase YjiC (YdhE family)
MVMIPQHADQFINAERAVAAGAAVSITRQEFSAEKVRAAAVRVRSDSSYARAAAVIRDQIAALPSAAPVARTIVAAAQGFRLGIRQRARA